jgi:PhnB protein
MDTSVSPMLAVPNGAEAMEFYKRAFGATERWQIGDGEVAGMFIDGAPFFFANETPSRGALSPLRAGGTTVRIELFVDDPQAWYERAVANGATVGNRVTEHQHPMTGPEPWHRMLQGGVLDPFGHVWLIGKPL